MLVFGKREFAVRLITLINVPLVWFLFPLGAWFADRFSDIPILVLWSVSTFNALIAHVIFGFAMTEGVYNPGMLQSFFMGGAGLYYLIFLRSLHTVGAQSSLSALSLLVVQSFMVFY